MIPAALDLTPALPELLLALSALGLLVLGCFRDEDAPRVVGSLAVITLVIAAVLALVLDDRAQTTFAGHFVLDRFASFLKVLIYLGAAAALLLSQAFLRDAGIERFEYPLLGLLAALGMGMMVSASSLMSLYMALELQSLALYVMAAFHRDTLRSTEAGLKYFVLGALASGMLLYGCSLVYGFTGTLMFDELARRLDGSVPLPAGALVGLVFILAGLAFKLAAVPFHMWTPDVYEGAPTPVTAFFATAPKVAAMGLTVRVLMQPFADHVTEWQQVVVAVSVGSMILGAFAAVGQTNIKRLMAYSGIGHMGYALVGLAAGTEKGAVGVLVYLAIYLATTLGTFACILMLRRQGQYVETIADLAGLSARRPLLAAALAAMMFSLAGIPPLAGFFGKLYVFVAAVDAGLWWLALIGVLTSVIGAYYYLRIVKLMYFDAPGEAFDPAPHVALSGVAAVSSLFVLLFVAVPGPVIGAAGQAAAALIR
jgi:NADH-quinone oxidoreductase subunit N